MEKYTPSLMTSTLILVKSIVHMVVIYTIRANSILQAETQKWNPKVGGTNTNPNNEIAVSKTQILSQLNSKQVNPEIWRPQIIEQLKQRLIFMSFK